MIAEHCRQELKHRNVFGIKLCVEQAIITVNISKEDAKIHQNVYFFK